LRIVEESIHFDEANFGFNGSGNPEPKVFICLARPRPDWCY
jgi:hypothetical protein